MLILAVGEQIIAKENSEVLMTQNEELELISKSNNGILRSSDVVKFARNPKTALHKRFEWDDTKAAEQYRLQQAGHLIRCYVIQMESSDKIVKVRAFQSLPSMRGGHEYQKTEDILSNSSWRKEMLETALAELGAFRKKYEILSELSEVWRAMDSVKSATKKKPKTHHGRAARTRSGKPRESEKVAAMIVSKTADA
jgi:hypothetical protein